MYFCFLDKYVREFFTLKLTTSFDFKKNPTLKRILIRLPCLGVLTLQDRNKLKSFIHKHNHDKTKLLTVDILSTIGENFHLIDRYRQLF